MTAEIDITVRYPHQVRAWFRRHCPLRGAGGSAVNGKT